MFDTIKSKVTIILTVITIVYVSIILFVSINYFKEFTEYLVKSYDSEVSAMAQQMNKRIVTLGRQSADLAVIGNSYYEKRIDKKLVQRYITSNLNHYQEPVGEGIWFEPYAINANKKYDAIYGMRKMKQGIVFYDLYNTEAYDYLHKDWYTRTIKGVTPENNLIWGLSIGDYTDPGLLITASSGIFSKGKLVGIAEVDWDFDLCVSGMEEIHPTPNTFAFFADKKNDFSFFSTDPYMDSRQVIGKSLEEIPWYNEHLTSGSTFKYHGKEYISFLKMMDNDMMLIVNIPKMEILGTMYAKGLTIMFIMFLLSAFLIFMLYNYLNSDIQKPINKLIDLAKKISSGEEGTEIKIEKPVEFAMLASTYDKMTNDIKQIIQNQTKMNYELSIANSIQISSLPNVFPPFPEHKEFSIYASMEPAKEVGGDFYDFYFKDKENLMFLVADVSGKGVPAALFMMTVKTLINNLSPTVNNPKELIQLINKKVCENNKEEFFVTMFAAIVNIRTGKMSCINCGHNPPLIKRNGGKYEYLKIEPNLALGIMDKISYDIYETTLNTGDSIFVYTDGVTEAVNTNDELYGEARLEACLNHTANNVPIESVIKNVKSNVKEFAQGQIQSDDLTMLLFQYFRTLRVFKRPAVTDNYKEFNNWLHTTCNEWGISDELANKLDMCGEEIFANICFYAYPHKIGNVAISLEKTEKELIMIFEDNGVIYNPLEKPDPDLNTDPKERKLGGLGIYMVKQMANNMSYERVKNKNILTLKFDI